MISPAAPIKAIIQKLLPTGRTSPPVSPTSRNVPFGAFPNDESRPRTTAVTAIQQTMPANVTNSTWHFDPDLPGRLRILIVGRAGAGKMTILQRVCNSTEDPEIYNDQGERVEFVKGSKDHDISHQAVFRSNQKFVFHVSLSYEARFEEEFENMKKFVTEHVNANFPKQIHAIWYCIPMDQFHQAITSAERRFFTECNTEKVPVVVIFTKWDALITQAFQPEYLQLSPENQLKRQRKNAEENFANRDIQGDLSKMGFPPKAYVQSERMDKFDARLNILLEKTAAALKDTSLQELLTIG